jgi:hypothetical protein
MPQIKVNTLIDRRGKELAQWEGFSIPKELKKAVWQVKELGGKVVVTWR